VSDVASPVAPEPRSFLEAARALVRRGTATSPQQPIDEMCESWHASFAEIEEDAQRFPELLDDVLTSAGSTAAFDDLRTTLGGLATEGNRAAERIRSLIDHVGRLRDEWTAVHRYTPEGLAASKEELEARFDQDGRSAAQAWLHQLLDAADAGEEKAAATIATAELPWPEELRAGAERISEAFGEWREDGPLPALDPVEEVAEGKLDEWDEVLTPQLRSRAHRFAAWIALRGRRDKDRAAQHMDKAVELYPYAGRMHAERAALRLFRGEFSKAATDAQHAIETTPQDPFGHLMLGIWAELTGKFSTADELYRRGFNRMPTAEVARIKERSALIDPPGRLLKMAAAVLLEARRPQQAFDLTNEALLSGIRGIEAHPEADVYVIRRKALEQLPDRGRSEAAEAGMQAGRLCLWNGDVECAIDELDHATKLGGSSEAGFLLADALLTKSFPLGAHAPDQELVARAHAVWTSSVDKGGPPRGAASWAYVTRAIIADLESQRPDTDRRRPGLFEALLYMEKALVHNHTDAQRWGYLSQYLRYLGYEQLAFEAAEAGYQLASVDRQVLAERLPLLANRREFAEAEAVARQLVAMYGEDPWVSAVRAWLALHDDQDWQRALQLLELPIAEGNDHAWYWEMCALAYLLPGDLDQARTAYRNVLDAEPIDGNTKCRLARASLALGERERAQAWLAKAREDSTTPRPNYVLTAALQAIADEDMSAAAERLREAIGLASSAVEVDDIVFETKLAMRAIRADGEQAVADRERTLVEAAAETVAERKAELERDPPTPDSEVESALKEVEGRLDTSGLALLALAARRDATAGRHDAAKRRYEQLRGTRFEPEAEIALDQQSQVVQ
jgi:tetratricopeptide (TPR) repeat protein